MKDFFTIRIERHIKEPTHTFSRFLFDGKFKYKGQEYLFTNQFRGVGIEDPIRDTKIHGKTAIPAGVYPLTLTNSPKFSGTYFRNEEGLIIQSNERETPAMALEYPTRHELVLINNIPNYSRVLIHWGNTVNDTEGCYIVGSTIGTSKGLPAVLSSRRKYVEIYPILYRAIKSGVPCNLIIS